MDVYIGLHDSLSLVFWEKNSKSLFGANLSKSGFKVHKSANFGIQFLKIYEAVQSE